MNKIFVVIILFLGCLCHQADAQELNAKITVNSDRLETTNKAIFTTMQNSLMEFVNGRKWSNATFSTSEKIDCNISIILLSRPTDDHFTAEITIQARRPVYNATYITNLLNFRDTQFEFDYVEGAPLEFIENTTDNSLVATVAFYINIILGLDFDSFSPLGGDYFFRHAQLIASQAQSYASWVGWTAFDSSNNRHALITALTDESLKAYREFWYSYHRKGLDEMVANPDRGRTTIINLLPKLEEIRNIRSSTILLQMFADSKLDEVVSICSKGSVEEKKETYTLLNKLFVTMSTKLEPLKK